MWGKLAFIGLVGITLPGCADPADYWAKLCEDMAQGDGVIGAGQARVSRAVVLDLGDTAVMWPDMTRYPQCTFPVALEFADDVELHEFDQLKSSAAGSSRPVIVSGRGEWTQIQWGDVGGLKLPGFAIASPKVHGPAEIPDEARKVLGPS